MSDPFAVVRDFEAALCEYTGAPYAVTVTSCSMALLLALKWALKDRPDEMITIPKHTYVSVPMSIMLANGRIAFEDVDWLGSYQLKPLNVWDSARHFTSNMYHVGTMQCVSFHASKTLGIEQGGAILLDDYYADQWLRRARFDGRREGVRPKDDTFDMVGYHCYMSPSVAAQGLLKLRSLSRYNAPLPNDDYGDLSLQPIFQPTF